ncbi:nicotinamidase-related amidase [Pseudomonas frederiksbergensis]|jgi:nicotinamidase-related amidase|uniref:cysteine hydrolase family protein n=1 Tax=Pseudomonas TaxID=286 RepID=UPI000DAB6230|nr:MULTISPECIES: cysteine hydrolase family protein [Pseudomonas]MBD9607202.1 cysteine hydrolase [Pseudomonas sp. PDM08]MBD9616910.1 cysteine hydrolase [Pseudomonas sp. PDM07]MDR7107438.1 nicotinamidase-related amidase [Pseudomonas frederiksbergensis]PZW63080.1 nicotinamidase-related amidase [Pseudomonas sp. URMO17WK12:I6]QDV94745.1 cysteine hydrolase [Pseudomonas sp. ATCC 43928]
MSTALLIIDVQRALCTGEYECFDIQRVIDTINGLSTKARVANIPVILIQHEEEGDLLQYGAEGWQLADGLKTSPHDLRVRKTTPDSFYQTHLHEHLQELDVERLIICGLQTDYCVNATVREALSRGYDVVLASDAHSTIDNGTMSAEDIITEHNKDLAHLTGSVARIDVVPASEINI